MNLRLKTIGFVLLAMSARAQPGPVSNAPDGSVLFRNQCGVCHVVDSAAPARQGPHLSGIVGRKPGSVAGYKYSAGYAQADFIWDPAHLDAYLTNPQEVIHGSTMAYKQAKPETRGAIIAYLESLTP